MALHDSTVSLLLEISADPKRAKEALETLRSQTENVTQAMAGNFSGLSKSIESALMGVFSPAGLIFGGIAALGGALFELAHKAAEAGEAVLHASEKTGIATEKLGGLQLAAKVTGTDFDALIHGFTIMARGLSPVASGTSTTAKALNLLGVATTDAHNKLRPMHDILLDLADKFHHMADGTDKAALAAGIFGGRLGSKFVALLNLGREGIEKFEEKAKALGYTFDKEGAEKSELFEAQLKLLEAQMKSLEREMGEKLIPFFLDLYLAIFGLEPAWEALKTEVHAQVMLMASLGSVVLAAVYAIDALADAATGDFAGVKDELKAVSGELDAMAGSFKDAWDSAGEGIEKLGQISDYTEYLREHLDELSELLDHTGGDEGGGGFGGTTKAVKDLSASLGELIQKLEDEAAAQAAGDNARKKALLTYSQELREINKLEAEARKAHQATAVFEQGIDQARLQARRNYQAQLEAIDRQEYERLKNQLIPAVEGLAKVDRDYAVTLREIAQISNAADRAYLSNLASLKHLADQMLELKKDADEVAQTMAGNFTGKMPAELQAAAQAFTPLTGAAKLAESVVSGFFSDSTLKIDEWAKQQNVKTGEILADYTRMVAGVKTQLGISNEDLENWAIDHALALSAAGEALAKYEGTVVSALNRELQAYGISAKALKGIFGAMLKDLGDFLAKKAHLKALDDIAMALDDIALGDYAGAEKWFMGAGAWEALGAGISAAAGMAAGAVGGGGGGGYGAGYGAGAVGGINPASLTPGQQQALLASGTAGALAPYQGGPQVVSMGGPPLVVHIHAEGMVTSSSRADFADMVTQAVSYGVTQLGMRAVASHTVNSPSISRGRP